MFNILIGAIIFSIWLITLFFGKSIGLSMVLFAVPLTGFIIYLLEKSNKIVNKKAKILIIPITLLSFTYCLFNNAFFNGLNIFVIPTLVVIMILNLLKTDFKININFVGDILGIFIIPISFIGEAFENLRQTFEEKTKKTIDSRKEKKVKKVIKSIFIIFPVVFIILILLATADNTFGSIIKEILINIFELLINIKLSTITVKIILTIFSFLYFLGLFYYINLKFESETKSKTNNSKVKDNFTIKLLLCVLNIIYFVFCIIQINSLFIETENIKYSIYARRGFFQLMFVSLINLITILIAKKSENKEEKNTYTNIMCVIMILFTFIILISSAIRMYLYESAYGYTFLRLLVYCILFTESCLLIPTVFWILEKKINLSKTYLGIVLTIYVGMNFINFDNIIAKRNVDRYFETGKIDIRYLETKTKTDAVGQIIRILETKKYEDNVQDEVEKYLNKMYQKLEKEEMDIRDFNISKMNAQKLIENTKK